MIFHTPLTKLLMKLKISYKVNLYINIIVVAIASCILYHFFYFAFPNTFLRVSILMVFMANIFITIKYIKNYLRNHELDNKTS